MGTGNDLKVRLIGRDEQLDEIVFALGDEVRQADPRRRHTEACMEIRAFEIRVDRDDPVVHPRQRKREIGAHERLANAAFPAAHRDDARTRMVGTPRDIASAGVVFTGSCVCRHRDSPPESRFGRCVACARWCGSRLCSRTRERLATTSYPKAPRASTQCGRQRRFDVPQLRIEDRPEVEQDDSIPHA